MSESFAGFPLAAGIFAVALAGIHLLAGRWEFARSERRRQFLSAGGGASVAYVFVLMLPEVSEAAVAVGELRADAFLAEQLVFLAALIGFVLFYGVEVAVTQHRRDVTDPSKTVYRVHLASFVVYSGLIGYLLFHQEVETFSNLFFYSVAMALHFAVTDYGLHRHYGVAFDTVGKLLLAGGTLVGAVIGFVTMVDELVLAMLFSLVAGAIVFNVIKEELPDVSESRFLAFLIGVAVFVSLVLLA
ncbi:MULTISPECIES: hypothetical protein [Haloferax]|uniref:Uncharacterized protein n=1 Tax=Haloferax marinum TaxID=2666143 RepID=A0A6A8GCI1_9EURY|nr:MULTISPECIES: hypothetical protein [Haloferax]KAB1190715.1 hypothetical protein Hfx1150_16915 [Haloferax sp. CBA1150]MRW98248.1 hypothetical protein [Haloferax marinum]